ncbi:MAG TPA: hypothetical protein VK572_18275, partial [Burkholderiales bacterium]|nr:hypothetical protein [Burkholderiales bacterium]
VKTWQPPFTGDFPKFDTGYCDKFLKLSDKAEIDYHYPNIERPAHTRHQVKGSGVRSAPSETGPSARGCTLGMKPKSIGRKSHISSR